MTANGAGGAGNGAADDGGNGSANGGNGASPLSGLRGALAAAIKGRNLTITGVKAAETALRRGREIEAAAAVNLAQFDDLDQKIADSRARRIADFAKSGNGELDPGWFDIGPALEKAQGVRDEAKARLAAAQQARAILGRQVQEVRATYDAAQVRVAHAAAAIVSAEAAELANELIELKQRTWTLQDRLQGLVQLGNSPVRPMPPQPLVVGALDLQRERFLADRLPGLPAPVEHESALWSAYLSHLGIDASAEWTWHPPGRRPLPPVGQIPGFVPGSLVEARRLARQGDEKALAALQRDHDAELPAIKAALLAAAEAAAADPGSRPPVDAAFAEMLAHRARGG